MKRFNKSALTFTLAITCAITLCCNFNSIYEKSTDIPNYKWSKSSKIKFDIPVSDTINGYNILLSLRNNNDYPYSNCFLFVNTLSPKGKTINDTIEFSLADDHGKWLGHGFGGVWSTEFYKKNIRFPFTGNYHIEVIQAMRDEPLNGIMDVSLRIEKAH